MENLSKQVEAINRIRELTGLPADRFTNNHLYAVARAKLGMSREEFDRTDDWDLMALLERQRHELAPAGKQLPSEGSEGRKAKKTVRRSAKYERIDEALREISEARPRNHAEVFKALSDREVPIPHAEPFESGGGWYAGFERDADGARAWLSKRWAVLKLPPFPRGPK